MFGELFERTLRIDENEKAIRTIYKIYKDQEKGFEPEMDALDIALEAMKEYYLDYIEWWTKGYGKDEPKNLKKDYNKRYMEIVHALQSDSVKDKTIALDNAINQWHIDFPVIDHLGMEAELEDEYGELSILDMVADTEEILRRLGRLPKESPYVRETTENYDYSFRYSHSQLWNNPIEDKEGNPIIWQKHPGILQGKRVRVFSDYQANWVEKHGAIPVR